MLPQNMAFKIFPFQGDVIVYLSVLSVYLLLVQVYKDPPGVT